MRAKVLKPPAREATIQVALRIPLSLVEGIDAHVMRLRGETGLPTITRTEAIIALVAKGLDAVKGSRRVAIRLDAAEADAKKRAR